MPRQAAAKNSEAVDDVDFVINTSDEETESGDDSMEEEDVEEVLDVTNIKSKGKRATKKRVSLEKTANSPPPAKRLTTEVVRTSPPSIKKERQQMSLTCLLYTSPSPRDS